MKEHELLTESKTLISGEDAHIILGSHHVQQSLEPTWNNVCLFFKKQAVNHETVADSCE